jgi:hypothetical protein
MAQLSPVAMAAFRNFHQANQVLPPVEERQQQHERQERHPRDSRFTIPDDEQSVHIDEYV